MFPSTTLASTRLPESPEADDLKKKAALRSRIWMVALVVAVGVLVLFVAGGFLSSFWNLYRHNQPPTRPWKAQRPLAPRLNRRRPMPDLFRSKNCWLRSMHSKQE